MNHRGCAGRRRILLPLAPALALLAAPATAVEIAAGGSLRQIAVYSAWPVDLGANRDGGRADTRIRPHLSLASARARLQADVEGRAAFSSAGADAGGTTLFAAPPAMRLLRGKITANARGIDAGADVERLDALIRAGPVDIDAGRQPISLGTAHYIGVLDVLAPFAPGDLDATFKPGVDALRIRAPLGNQGEAELIGVGADPLSDAAAVGRLRLPVRTYDVEFVGGRLRRRAFGGLGWEGAFGPVGWWGEAAAFQRLREARFGGWRRAAFSGATGVEGRPTGKLLLGGGALWQDFGVRRAADLIALQLGSADDPHRQGWVYLGGAAYALATVQWQAHALVAVQAAGLVNLNDGSSLWEPTVQINAADDADVTAFAWAAVGRRAVVTQPLPTLRSEFGTAPSGGGLYARWFF